MASEHLSLGVEFVVVVAAGIVAGSSPAVYVQADSPKPLVFVAAGAGTVEIATATTPASVDFETDRQPFLKSIKKTKKNNQLVRKI